MDDFTAKLWLYYISEILVASVNQKMFNNLSDRGRGTKKKNHLSVVLEAFD